MVKKYSAGKYTKYKLMYASSALRPYLPLTKKADRSTIWYFLDRYGKVILKPSKGSGGVGIIKVTKAGTDVYKVHHGARIKSCRGKKNAYSYIKNRMKHLYIAQKYISLAKVGGRPFDIRVMVQRKKGSTTWKVTGKLAKIAGKGYLITNVARSGGKVVTIEEAMRKAGIRSSKMREMMKELDRIGIITAKRLSPYYTYTRTFGLDVGVTTSDSIRIIECNTTPSRQLFKKLKDKSMYRRIIGYDKK